MFKTEKGRCGQDPNLCESKCQAGFEMEAFASLSSLPALAKGNNANHARHLEISSSHINMCCGLDLSGRRGACVRLAVSFWELILLLGLQPTWPCIHHWMLYGEWRTAWRRSFWLCPGKSILLPSCLSPLLPGNRELCSLVHRFPPWYPASLQCDSKRQTTSESSL